MFTSEAYTLKNNTTIDGQFITAGELFVRAKYICYIQESTNWFWDQHYQQQVITGTTCKILHTRLDAIAIIDINGISKSVCNKTQLKKAISRHPIGMTYSE